METYSPYKNENRLLTGFARTISALFNPFFIPFWAFFALFVCTYLRIMPLQYKLIVMGMVACFTIVIPMLTILVFRIVYRLGNRAFDDRRVRILPYLFTILTYIFCFFMMRRLKIPWYMTGIIFSALVISILCFIVNLKFRISHHMVGIGAIIGGLVSFSELFSYNPLWILSVLILFAGMLGSARIILRRQTFGEVVSGFVLGFAGALLVLHPATNYVFYKLFV